MLPRPGPPLPVTGPGPRRLPLREGGSESLTRLLQKVGTVTYKARLFLPKQSSLQEPGRPRWDAWATAVALRTCHRTAGAAAALRLRAAPPSLRRRPRPALVSLRLTPWLPSGLCADVTWSARPALAPSPPRAPRRPCPSRAPVPHASHSALRGPVRRPRHEGGRSPSSPAASPTSNGAQPSSAE